MLKLGIILTAATVTILVAEYFRTRRRPLPAHGWLGLIALVCAEFLMFHRVEPAATYFNPLAWTAYILLADAAAFAITGQSRLLDEARGFLKMGALSVFLWLIFEAYNLRLANWTYVGLPQGRVESWFGYAWSFATITPGIFITAALVESFGWFKAESRRIRFGRTAENVFMALGAALLVIPIVVPRRISMSLFAFFHRRPRARLPWTLVFVSYRGMGLRLAVGILELLGGSEVDLHVSDFSAMEDLRNAFPRISGFPCFCARMLRDVCNRRVGVQPQIRR